MNTIVFLEVDDHDIQTITAKLPNSTCKHETIELALLDASVKAAEVFCCFIYSNFTKQVLDQLPNIKLICTRSVGTDHIDMAECNTRGITVCNVPDYGSHVIAEHVFALLLSTIRHIPQGDTRTEAGAFEYRGLRGMALKHKTLAIIGTGKIGACVAKIAHGFSMHCIAVDQCRRLDLEQEFGVQYVSLEEAITKADIITLHVPATEQTKHMLSNAQFAAMKPGVIIINTARGALIDSKALLQALHDEKVQYALLDVLEHEQNFADNKELLEHPRVVTTPHIAFYADDSMRKMYEVSIESIVSWQNNTPLLHTVSLPNIVCDLPKIMVQ